MLRFVLISKSATTHQVTHKSRRYNMILQYLANKSDGYQSAPISNQRLIEIRAKTRKCPAPRFEQQIWTHITSTWARSTSSTCAKPDPVEDIRQSPRWWSIFVERYRYLRRLKHKKICRLYRSLNGRHSSALLYSIQGPPSWWCVAAGNMIRFVSEVIPGKNTNINFLFSGVNFNCQAPTIY